MSAADLRTVGELLADSDALARETLLDTTPNHAPAMVRSWNQLVESGRTVGGLALRAAQLVGVGFDGTVAGDRGGDWSQRHRRALAWARTDR